MCITHRLGIIKTLWFVTVEIIKCLWFGVPSVFFFRAIENWLFVYLFCSILGAVCGIAWGWPWGYACRFSAVMVLPAGENDSEGILGAWRGEWEGKERAMPAICDKIFQIALPGFHLGKEKPRGFLSFARLSLVLLGLNPRPSRNRLRLCHAWAFHLSPFQAWQLVLSCCRLLSTCQPSTL